MSPRCLKRSEAVWRSDREDPDRGSAQVIEFSYVFPVVLVTVVALLYLLLLLFFHVYAFHVTERAAEDAARAVGGDRVYWQLSAHGVDPETLSACSADMERRLTAMQVMPGLRFSSSLKENATGSQVTAMASCSFHGNRLFTVRSERDLRKPTEYAANVDLAEDIAEDTGLKTFLEQRFGRYIQMDKEYL